MKGKDKLKTLIIVGVYLISAYAITGGFCVLRATVGFPCPACGMTRAFLSLFALDLHGAFTAHPLFWAVPVVGAFVAYDKIAPHKINQRLFRIVMWSATGAVMLLYIVRLVLFFPHTEPMTINSRSLLMRLVGLVWGFI
ncbi:MAG: DUF2752 domain-containing protein [Oscillospiraceae bacterium]|nr:DUF2752 domain-containing protein [Oscillospiraceae bacterium]